MSGEWQLRRCECGHTFGCNAANSASCTRCGSLRSTPISNFEDSRQLAVAVSNANLPREISQDIKNRIMLKDKMSVYSAQKTGNLRSKSIQSMHDATDHHGILTIASLERELSRKGISEPSSEHLIGQAEMEGILLRQDDDSWSWLQQSS